MLLYSAISLHHVSNNRHHMTNDKGGHPPHTSLVLRAIFPPWFQFNFALQHVRPFCPAGGANNAHAILVYKLQIWMIYNVNTWGQVWFLFSVSDGGHAAVCLALPGGPVSRPQATLKIKYVSCAAGGRNYGHSGGRKNIFISFYFRKKNTSFFSKIENKSSHPQNIKTTRALHRKHSFFQGGPRSAPDPPRSHVSLCTPHHVQLKPSSLPNYRLVSDFLEDMGLGLARVAPRPECQWRPDGESRCTYSYHWVAN